MNTNTPVWTAELIKAARKQRGMTQVTLAEGLGCRQQTVSEWELNMYAPKNAYQRLLTMFFGKAPEETKTNEAANYDAVKTSHPMPVAPKDNPNHGTAVRRSDAPSKTSV